MNVSDTSIELSDVAVARGGRTLLSSLSFTLGPGRLALLTGPNGSGKTSLLRVIAGLSPPAAGRILVAGRPVAELEPEDRRRIAYQAHLEGLKKDLTIEENLLFISHLHGSPSSVSSIIQDLGLADLRHRAVRRLSAGQKRRTALAALKLSRADVWLLDEPLTNLDRSGRELVVRWIDEHLAARGSAIVATHLVDDLLRPGSLLVEL